MSGGAGHVMDMNNRMKQNRSMKTSNRKKFKSNNRDLSFSNTQSKKLNFKKVSEEELEQIKNVIRLRSKKAQQKNNLILLTIVLIVFVSIIILIF